ncbi:uncharacterized protein TrAtP1_009740 [Trichoderma atroviride]|uniref:Subtilisin-like serine protease n=1 Tax=Hypocrea atroviridis (strain ATCC 20476 / IMI 206040) TaxID=452589 RepID=G9NKS9_HYPAI|nr:uncharacterized protein TRIATDRAFT_54026 [Trichoderma atroviride IMI 206040]EHK48501.1 hypothetical protein TRIATDRAFT_54026 [Trichoderma atroviride IMI 206040]UKZ68717.1 hypothetical protein TrAtP1_009740 [Trichoderma atroviride]
MNEVPFPSHRQLCSELFIVEGTQRVLTKGSDNVDPSAAISQEAADSASLLGHPWVRLRDPYNGISQFLKDELITDSLDKLAPHLWLVATQNSTHISSLTHQLVRGRQIVVTEDPGLHLTWIYERVFIKPLPEYLLSHAFWDYFLVNSSSPIPSPDRKAIFRAACGFLRSYAFLIQHKSDYLLAIQDDKLDLIPKSIPFSDLVEFLRCFKSIPDTEVSPRYLYRDLRLTRLNFWVKIFQGKRTYFKQYGQYGAYFAQFYGPLLFVFGIITLALSSMQVVLAAESVTGFGDGWMSFVWMSQGFSIFTLCLTLLLSLFLIASPVLFIFREVIYAAKHHHHGELVSECSSGAARGKTNTEGVV